MPGPRSSLPSLDDAIAFAKGVARVLSQMTGDPYGEPLSVSCVPARKNLRKGSVTRWHSPIL